MLSVPGELEAYSVCLHSVLSSVYVGQISAVSRDFLFAQSLTKKLRNPGHRNRSGYGWKAIVD